jgi:GTPase SAR1 family protein
MGCGGSKTNKQNERKGPSLKITNKNAGGQRESARTGAKLEAKIVLVGNSGVGKTCIATRYKEGKFTSDHKPTVGASYFQKNF